MGGWSSYCTGYKHTGATVGEAVGVRASISLGDSAEDIGVVVLRGKSDVACEEDVVIGTFDCVDPATVDCFSVVCGFDVEISARVTTVVVLLLLCIVSPDPLPEPEKVSSTSTSSSTSRAVAEWSSVESVMYAISAIALRLVLNLTIVQNNS